MRGAETDPDREPVAAEDAQRRADLLGPEVRLGRGVRVGVERHDQEAPHEREERDQQADRALRARVGLPDRDVLRGHHDPDELRARADPLGAASAATGSRSGSGLGAAHPLAASCVIAVGAAVRAIAGELEGALELEFCGPSNAGAISPPTASSALGALAGIALLYGAGAYAAWLIVHPDPASSRPRRWHARRSTSRCCCGRSRLRPPVLGLRARARAGARPATGITIGLYTWNFLRLARRRARPVRAHLAVVLVQSRAGARWRPVPCRGTRACSPPSSAAASRRASSSAATSEVAAARRAPDRLGSGLRPQCRRVRFGSTLGIAMGTPRNARTPMCSSASR